MPSSLKLTTNQKMLNLKNLSKIAILVEPSITILKDADFSLYSFPGNGSTSNPYLIEDTTYSFIRISNITKHVIIQNCTLTYNDCPIRIGLTAPNSIVIINNTMTNGASTSFNIGIFVNLSPGIIIKDNIIGGFSWGINFNFSPNCLIDNNTIFDSNFFGIRIEDYAPSSIISNNTIFDSDIAMRLENSYGLLIEDNHCFSNRIGIILHSTSSDNSSSNCIIRHNLIINHQSYGITISGFFNQDFSSNNLVYLNTLLDNNPNGTSQAKDVGSNNVWYNSDSRQGNYWSDWFGIGSYKIDGEAKAIDKYPLRKAYHEIDISTFNFIVGRLVVVFVVFVSLLLILGVIIVIQKKKGKIARTSISDLKNLSSEK